jgi:hypothetical protein
VPEASEETASTGEKKTSRLLITWFTSQQDGGCEDKTRKILNGATEGESYPYYKPNWLWYTTKVL